MYKPLISCMIIITISITACTSPQHVPASSVTPDLAAREMVASATYEPAQETSPTSTLLSASPTSYPRLTPTPAEEGLIQQCAQVNISLPKEIVPPGILVINTIGHGISLLNFTKQTHRDITGTIISVGTSPDGKWLAYNTTTNNSLQLIFESIDGEKTIRISKEKSWSSIGIIHWMDNQRIWFPEISTIQPATSVQVLNPFTGQKNLFKTDYPGTTHYNFGPSFPGFHFGYSSAVYDPSLNFVVYPEFEQGNGYFQTLWDRKSQKAVARVSNSGYYQNLPIWRESQKQFLLVGFPNPTVDQNEWVRVSLDGQVHQITDFWKIGQKYSIENDAALSPDGKILAFSLSFKKADGYTVESTHLILLDLVSQKATDTCLSAGKITWSLDGKFLAISTPLESGGNDRIFLLDPNANQSYQLMEGSSIIPIGWLIQP
jgi:hypothetical protein